MREVIPGKAAPGFLCFQIRHMKTDAQIHYDVLAELGWNPDVDAVEIGVAVKNGVVTLSGMVYSFEQKIAVEKAVKRVSGVRAVADELTIGPSNGKHREDCEIARDVLDALAWHRAVDDSRIKVTVDHGVVTLEGDVDTEYQREAAIAVVKPLTGIRWVNNRIDLRPLSRSVNPQSIY